MSMDYAVPSVRECFTYQGFRGIIIRAKLDNRYEINGRNTSFGSYFVSYPIEKTSVHLNGSIVVNE